MQLGGHNIQDFSITRIISHSIVLYHKTTSLCKRKKHRRRWNKNILWNNRRTIRRKNRNFIQSFEKMLPEAGICTTAAHGRAGWEGSPAGEVSTHRASPQSQAEERCRPAPRQSRSLTWKAAGTSARQTSVFLRRETWCLF